MLIETLSTVFAQIKYLIMLAKAAKNPYSDRNLVKIAMDIIRNTNDFKKGKADWYVKIPVKQTRKDFKRHFEATLRLLHKIQGNTMLGTAYHQANLLQVDKTHYILGEFNTLDNGIAEAL